MAVEVEVTGHGAYAGGRTSVAEYSITGSVVGLTPDDSSGAVPGLSFTVQDDPSREGSVLLYGSTLNLRDADRGGLSCYVDSVRGSNGDLSVSAFGRLGRMVSRRTAAAVDGTFDEAIRYYLSLGGITENVAVADALFDVPVIAPGWTGDAWEKIKELCSVYGAEIAQLNDDIVVRPVRGRAAFEYNNEQVSWSIGGDTASEVTVAYYNTATVTEGVIYPTDGWDPEARILSVDFGNETSAILPLEFTISEVFNPVVQDFIPHGSYASGGYTVRDRNGDPVSASDWESSGAGVFTAIGEDSASIELRIVGPKGVLEGLGPFKLSGEEGGEEYPALWITGTGASVRRETVTVATGALPETSRDSAPIVDSIFVATRDQALDIALAAAARWAAPQREITVSKVDVRKSDNPGGDLNYASFADFNAYCAAEGIVTFADFNAEWAGRTFADFNDYWYEKARNEFDLQLFGNVSGSRMQYRRAMYRVRSDEVTKDSVRFTAEADTTFADFNASAGSMTFAEFNALYAGLTFGEMTLIPLPRVDSEYDRV